MIATATCVFALYQNFDFLKLDLKPVDKVSRKTHAKELLGKHYLGSCAQQAEDVADLHISIFNQIYAGLPKKFKGQAEQIARTIIEDSEYYDIDPVFILAIIKTESNFNPLVRGRFGEIGLMQVKPDTAAWISRKEGYRPRSAKSLENPVENVRVGIAYVNYLRNNFGGYANKYLSAYNMGARNVRRLYASEKKPKEYTSRVMKNYNDLYIKMVAIQVANIADN